MHTVYLCRHKHKFIFSECKKGFTEVAWVFVRYLLLVKLHCFVNGKVKDPRIRYKIFVSGTLVAEPKQFVSTPAPAL